MDDFYIIVASNGCTNIFPNNRANYFKNTWENPINLDSNWSVALTEANFNYTQSSVNSDFGIEYDTIESYKFSWKASIKCSKNGLIQYKNITLFPKPTNPTFDEWAEPLIRVDAQDHLVLLSNAQLQLTFPSLEAAQKCGFDKFVTEESTQYSNNKSSYNFALRSPNPIEKAEKVGWEVEHIKFEFTSRPYTNTLAKFIPADALWHTKKQKFTSPDELAESMQTGFGEIFNSVKFENDHISLTFNDHIPRIKLLNGINFLFGFRQVEFKVQGTDSRTFNAEFPPQLSRGISNMYIYASMCSPMRVGGVEVPLLKSVWIDTQKKYQFGEVCNVVVKNPMYIPLASTSINTIEINVRTDSGQYLPFFEGAVTNLTLHFKKR